MNSDKLLFRQINPNWIKEGRPTHQAFKPTKKDYNKLSVYDGSKINAKDSWIHYTNELRLNSSGVLAVTEGECLNIELKVIPDSSIFPEHILIDFNDFSKALTISKAQILTKRARDRGWQYQP